MITFILGTRPEIIKLGPLVRLISAEQRTIIWTGQHWSPELAEAVWAEAGFQPDKKVFWSAFTEICDSDGTRLAGMIRALTEQPSEVWEKRPPWVVVQGDTTSALAGALAAGKLGIPVYHVEAGSRSGDRSQPEELNRLLIDRIATGHSCSYLCDQANLLGEGIADSLWAGDTLIDSVEKWAAPGIVGKPSGEVLATIHRAETLSNREALAQILEFLRELSQGRQVHLFVHPHLRDVLNRKGRAFIDWLVDTGLMLREPPSPSGFRSKLARAAGFVTDSGGAATEAAWLGVPTVIARETTELQDLVRCGRLVVGGRTVESLQRAWGEAKRNVPLSPEVKQAWNGHAAEKIAEVILG